MADLRALFVDLGYDDVRTVLQSGNVLFRAARELAAESAAQIETALVRHTNPQAPGPVVRADARAMPFADRSFGAVLPAWVNPSYSTPSQQSMCNAGTRPC